VKTKNFCRALLVGAAGIAAMFVAAGVRTACSTTQWDYGEGHSLWMARQIFDGGRAYGPIDRVPFVIFPYTPLYLFAANLLGRLGDPLVAGRLLSLACAVALAAVIALTIYFSTPRRAPRACRLAAAAAGGALVLTANTVFRWGSLYRVDMMAIFLMEAGVGTFIVFGTEGIGLFVSAMLFVLALFTKQSMLAGPLACVILGFWLSPRKTAGATSAAGLLGLAGLLAMNARTGNRFWRHILLYNLQPYNWHDAARNVYDHVLQTLPAAALGTVAIAALFSPGLVRRGDRARRLRRRIANVASTRALAAGGLHFILAGVWMLAIGKMGSDFNFFLEWDVAARMLAGLLVFRLLLAAERIPGYLFARAAPLLLVVMFMAIPSWNLLLGAFRNPVSPARREEDRRLLALLRATRGPVYSENLLAVQQAGKEVEIEPATITFLTLAGRWDERRLVEMIEQKRFEMIAFANASGPARLTPAKRRALERAYEPVEAIGSLQIYRPR
jgi:hypothetical protein